MFLNRHPELVSGSFMIKEKNGFVYMVGNNVPTIYIGVTSNLIKRIFEHKQGKINGFTKKYKLSKLLFYEFFDNIISAIKREKQLKNWHRSWKLNLIRSKNPEFKDLYDELIDAETSSA